MVLDSTIYNQLKDAFCFRFGSARRWIGAWFSLSRHRKLKSKHSGNVWSHWEFQNLRNWKELYFQNGKRYHVENLDGSLFLRDILLDGDKTLKVLAILEYGFLWRHLKAKISTWQITELANQRARKALFTCVVYMHTPRPRLKRFSISYQQKDHWLYELETFLIWTFSVIF